MLYGIFLEELLSESFILKLQTKSRKCRFYKENESKRSFLLHKLFQDLIFFRKKSIQSVARSKSLDAESDRFKTWIQILKRCDCFNLKFDWKSKNLVTTLHFKNANRMTKLSSFSWRIWIKMWCFSIQYFFPNCFYLIRNLIQSLAHCKKINPESVGL